MISFYSARSVKKVMWDFPKVLPAEIWRESNKGSKKDFSLGWLDD